MDHLAGKTLIKADGSSIKAEEALADKTIILYYFSAHWCPPCRHFTPILKAFYEKVKAQGVEVIFISSDNNAEEQLSYMKESHGDWFALENESEVGKALETKFQIEGIPTLVVVKKDGTLVTKEGRDDVDGKGELAVKEWIK